VADGTPTVGDGLDATLFASATRDDGDEQVTVDGWPLYFFSGDVSPGDTNGQGVGDVWYVVGADGAAIEGG
jgi:predicted lipoprotein with Yx(FWY)xxD motif